MTTPTLRSLGVTGRVTVADPKRPEPPDGEHDWTMLIQFRLDKAEAAASHEGVEQLLDPAKVVYWTPVFCVRCEQAYVGGLSRDPDGRIAEHPHPEGEWVCDACYPRPLEEVRGPGTRAT